MAYTTDDLVAAVRRLAFLPDADDLLTADILALADEEMATVLAQRVSGAREEHWVKTEDITLVSGTLRYRLPRRALARAVRGIVFVSTSTGATSPAWEIDPMRAQPGDGGTEGRAYYYEDDFVVFPVAPPTGYKLRVRYLRRPSRLVPVASCAAIVKATDTTHILASTVPLTPAAQYVDTVRGDSPFDLSYVDLGLKGLATLTYELSAATPIVVADFVDLASIPNDRQDYICPRDQTCYPPIPAELHASLAAAVARQIAAVKGDRPGAELAEATMQRRLRASTDILEPRDQAGSRPIVNRSSPLRQGRGSARRWR